MVYTVGTVAVIATGAGVYYYLSHDTEQTSKGAATGEKRKSKKDRRKAKKDVEAGTSEPAPKAGDEKSGLSIGHLGAYPQLTGLVGEEPRGKVATVEPEAELPQVDEMTVDTLDTEVRLQDIRGQIV